LKTIDHQFFLESLLYSNFAKGFLKRFKKWVGILNFLDTFPI